MTVHPIFETILASHGAPLLYRRTDDLPRATVPATAELFIGTVWIADVEGNVTVYREDGVIRIDDYEIVGQRHGRQAIIGCGRKSHALSYRDINDDEALEHICAGAFMALERDPSFIERAEIALAEVERDWRRS